MPIGPEEREKIMRRQTTAWDMRIIHGISPEQIAQALGISQRTVRNDLAQMRRRAAADLKKTYGDAKEAAVEVLILTEKHQLTIISSAWADYQKAAPGSSARARFLRIVQVAITERVNYLQSLAVLPKTADEIILTEADLERRISRLSDEELESALAFLESVSAQGHAGDSLGVDDAGAADDED
jgi:hypothetical protein